MNKVIGSLAMVATVTSAAVYAPERSYRVFNRYEETKIRIADRHQRYGLTSSRATKLGAGQAEYDDDLSDFSNFLVGWANGLSFDSNSIGPCEDTFYTLIDSYAQFWDVLKEIYLPWRWADMGFVVQDWFEVTAAQSAECDINKVLNTVSGFITSEGQEELWQRILGGLIAVIPNNIEAIGNAENAFDAGKASGAITQVIFDWTIS